MKRLFVITLAPLLALIITASAAEKKAPVIRTDLQIASISSKDALTLVPKLRNKDTATDGVKQIEQMIEDDKAELIDWMTTLCFSGSRSTSESAQEVRYPTEFEPPMFPQNFGVGNPPSPESDRLNPILKAQRLNTAFTAFETRNIGTTLEIEPKVIGTNLVEATLAPQYVRLDYFKEYPLPVALNGTHYTMVLPYFSTHKNTEHLTLISGQWILIGTYLEKDESKTVLFLLRATIKP